MEEEDSNTTEFNDVEFIKVNSFICLLYTSINFNLYSKFFNNSVALPKCIKFSKWVGVTVSKSKEAVSIDLTYP